MLRGLLLGLALYPLVAHGDDPARKAGIAHKRRGDEFAQQGRLVEAAAAYRAALRADPDLHLARYNLAHALRKERRHAEAEKEYAAYLRAEPDDPDAHYGLAETLKALGRPEEARRTFERYIALEKRPGESAWVENAKKEVEALRQPVAEKEKRIAAPEASALRAPALRVPALAPVAVVLPSEAAPKTLPEILSRAEASFRLRRYPAAEKLFALAVVKEPQRAELHYKLAAARAAAGDLAGAIEAWDAVLALDPANETVRDLALRARERLGLLAPRRADAAEAASGAAAALEKGRPVQALRGYDRALAATTRAAPDLLVGRAIALMALGRYDEAVRSLLEATALRPGSALVYYHLGTCYRRLGEARQASYYFRMFLSLANPADPIVAPKVVAARRWLAAEGRH